MVWYKIDSGSGRLWVRLMEALERLFEWIVNDKSKNRPSPLKRFTATEGN